MFNLKMIDMPKGTKWPQMYHSLSRVVVPALSTKNGHTCM